MPKISFYLKRPSPERESAIILMYTCDDGRLKYYTGQKGLSTGFDKGTDARLARIKQIVQVLEIECKISDVPFTRELVTDKLNSIYKEKFKADDLFVYMDRVLEKMQSGKIVTPDSKRYSEGTIKSLNHTKNILKKFDPKLRRATVTMETYNKFIAYCQEQNYAKNYIGSLIKNWKTLGKMSGNNPIYSTDLFRKVWEETPHVYLNEEELKAIYEKPLTKPLDNIRDWFILCCYTGLRVSDLLQLTERNYSKGFITIANEKTDATVVIPAHPIVKEIIKKHNGFPPKSCQQKINFHIKEIAKSAGVNTSMLFTITKGGKRIDKYVKKWELITCHTGRRSLVTNMRKTGISDSITMKLTGIKATATLRKYDKLSNEEAAKIAAKHEFFK